MHICNATTKWLTWCSSLKSLCSFVVETVATLILIILPDYGKLMWHWYYLSNTELSISNISCPPNLLIGHLDLLVLRFCFTLVYMLVAQLYHVLVGICTHADSSYPGMLDVRFAAYCVLCSCCPAGCLLCSQDVCNLRSHAATLLLLD